MSKKKTLGPAPPPKVIRLKKRVDQKAVLDNLKHMVKDPCDEHGNVHYTLLWAIVASYDQEIDREDFVQLVNAALNAKHFSAGTATLMQCAMAAEAADLDDEMFKRSIDHNMEGLQACWADMYQKFWMVEQCRGDDDKLN